MFAACHYEQNVQDFIWRNLFINTNTSSTMRCSFWLRNVTYAKHFAKKLLRKRRCNLFAISHFLNVNGTFSANVGFWLERIRIQLYGWQHQCYTIIHTNSSTPIVHLWFAWLRVLLSFLFVFSSNLFSFARTQAGHQIGRVFPVALLLTVWSDRPHWPAHTHRILALRVICVTKNRQHIWLLLN